MTVYLGAAKLVASEITVRPALGQVPHWLSQSGMVTPRPKPPWLIEPIVPNFPLGIWGALALAAGLAVVLRYSVFGRHVFALGSNEATARLCGVRVPLVKIAVYALGGAFVGVAGVYQVARLGEGNPASGIGMELRIIAAVVIGGGSLSGGRGSVLGTLAGAAMLASQRLQPARPEQSAAGHHRRRDHRCRRHARPVPPTRARWLAWLSVVPLPLAAGNAPPILDAWSRRQARLKPVETKMTSE